MGRRRVLSIWARKVDVAGCDSSSRCNLSTGDGSKLSISFIVEEASRDSSFTFRGGILATNCTRVWVLADFGGAESCNNTLI